MSFWAVVASLEFGVGRLLEVAAERGIGAWRVAWLSSGKSPLWGTIDVRSSGSKRSDKAVSLVLSVSFPLSLLR